MFSLALLALALTSTLSSATPAEPPSSVHSIDDIKVTAVVTNTGSEAVKVLKYGTILDGNMPTRSFVVSKDGVYADFTGIKLSLDLTRVNGDAFVTIPAGETVTVNHDVAPLYDFESLGTGIYTFEPVDTFQGVNEDAKLSSFKVSDAPLKVEVKHDVAKRELKVNKRAVNICTNSSEASFISSAYSEGKSLASIASSYVASNGANSLFKLYFGNSSTTTVRNVLNNVANENASNRTLDCSDPHDQCDGNVVAYTWHSGSTGRSDIYFCSIFYRQVTTSKLCSGTSATSRNFRGGTVLHELTHATSRTHDFAYGCVTDQSLSPSQAAMNADSYNCFATQVYAATKC
ncbi:Metalloprotease [Irpex lacteus]|nr:Metalloprotease [Irpex lacteus]